MKNNQIGEGYGIIVGEQVQINMEIQFLIVCIDICGRTALKNVWNLQITRLMNILVNPFLLFHQEKFYMIIF